MPLEASTSSASNKSYHPHYDDPRDDLELQSNDGVLFKVSSHKLAKASPVFRNMISMASPDTPNGEPIALDHPSSVLVDFLDVVSVSRVKEHITCLFFDRTLALARFTDAYGGDELHQQVVTHLLRTAKGPNAFELLVYASDRDDWSLAANALRGLGAKTFSGEYFDDVKAFDRYIYMLSKDMQLALFNAIAYQDGTLNIPTYFTSLHKSFAKPENVSGSKRPSDMPASDRATKK